MPVWNTSWQRKVEKEKKKWNHSSTPFYLATGLTDFTRCIGVSAEMFTDELSAIFKYKYRFHDDLIELVHVFDNREAVGESK